MLNIYTLYKTMSGRSTYTACLAKCGAFPNLFSISIDTVI